MKSTKMLTGTITTVLSNGRVAFISTPQSDKDVFVHVNEVEGVSMLKSKMQLTFEIKQGPKGPQAYHARLVQTETQSTNRYPPYHFVPPYLKNAIIDTPVFHDGSHDNNEARYSGELRCTLTALTPLLVGNDQYDVETVQDANKRGDSVTLPQEWQIPLPVKKDKKVLEPLRLADGRVVINGATLKGLLRQSIGALLMAPMERVAERTYSYRPNAKIGKGKRTCHPAIVMAVDSEIVTVKVLPDTRDALFVRDNAFKKLNSPKPNDLVRGNFNGLKKEKQRLIISNLRDKIDLDHFYFNYVGGIDGEGILAKSFNSDAKVYHHVLVELSQFEKAKEYTISKAVLDHYNVTQEHLQNNKTGHLRDEHPLTKNLNVEATAKAIKNSKDIKPYQLIYVELDNQPESGEKPEIVSLGHHFRYRWRYADTVRWTKNGKQTRDILKPVSEETEYLDETGAPKALSGARLLFGYVSGEQNEGTEDIGKNDFQRLAGRIGFNMAVEVIAPNAKADTDERFLNADKAKAAVVPLKILGMPRPSAVEFYLEQNNTKNRKDGGTLTTYGDILGETTGELNGRKFYLHQPDAAKDATCYTDETEEVLSGNQAALARFVSKPGTQFRFTLRFRDLRTWELGALLIALEPERLITKLEDNTNPLNAYCGWLQKLTPSEQPLFAHKIGHGRPLGLGSVHLKIDDLDCWTATNEPPVMDKKILQNQSVNDFFAKLPLKDNVFTTRILARWFGVHLYRGQTRADYPQEDGSTFAFHSNLRLRHLAARRSDDKPQPEPNILSLLLPWRRSNATKP
ncbi:secreted protein [Beggiatoa sp. PS]|nr:secreted protein [Beggiatoa sp. PS]